MKSVLCLIAFILFCTNAGIGQVIFNNMAYQLNIDEWESSLGVAIIDLNDDCSNEIFVTNMTTQDRLYFWQDSLYVDLAPLYGVNQTLFHHNVCIADIDKDLRPDLYVTGDPNGNIGKYYLNRGYPPFTDMAQQYNLRQVQDMGSTFFQMTRFAPLSGIIGGHLMVWHDTAFIDVTQGSGLESMYNVHCPLCFDIDGDTDDDIFIAGNYTSNSGRLFRNNGNGTFTDISTNTNQGGFPVGQGATMGDIDNDGDFDLYITSGFDQNSMWENNGSGFFVNVTAQSNTGVGGYSRSACFGDFDNDGSVDLFVNRANDYNVLFHNDGTGVFTDISRQAGVMDNYNGFGCATGDLNNDGQLDIIAVNYNGDQNQVYINQGNSNSYVRIKLLGLERNSLALGGIIRLYGINADYSDTVFLGIREIQSLTTMFSVNEPIAHFGTQQYQNLMADVIFQSLNHIIVGDLIPGNTYYISERPTAIDEQSSSLPHKYMAMSAYPNPFNNSVKISAVCNTDGMLAITIYDLMGRQVKTAIIDVGETNRHSYTWDGKNDQGQQCPSGVYIVKAKSSQSQARIKITYLK